MTSDVYLYEEKGENIFATRKKKNKTQTNAVEILFNIKL